jgi:hypothetical protein
MLWITVVASLRRGEYVEGLRMSPRSQDTWWDHAGGFGESDTADHFGSPERL